MLNHRARAFQVLASEAAGVSECTIYWYHLRSIRFEGAIMKGLAPSVHFVPRWEFSVREILQSGFLNGAGML